MGSLQSWGRFQPFCPEENGGSEVKVLSLIWSTAGLCRTQAWPRAGGEGWKRQELRKRSSAVGGGGAAGGEPQGGDQAPDVFLPTNPGFLPLFRPTDWEMIGMAKVLCSLS